MRFQSDKPNIERNLKSIKGVARCDPRYLKKNNTKSRKHKTHKKGVANENSFNCIYHIVYHLPHLATCKKERLIMKYILIAVISFLVGYLIAELRARRN